MIVLITGNICHRNITKFYTVSLKKNYQTCLFYWSVCLLLTKILLPILVDPLQLAALFYSVMPNFPSIINSQSKNILN